MSPVKTTKLIAPPSREALQEIDDRAWQLYHDVVWDPDATVDDRQNAFEAALASLTMLLDHDHREQLAYRDR